MNVTRRGFLRFLGGTAATAASGCALKAWGDLQEAVQEEERGFPGVEEWVTSTCGQCPAGCGIRVRVVDGKAVRIEGNPFHPVNRGGLCPKGLAGLQVLYNPDRLKGPLKRAGGRGQGRWEPISWAEAITTVVAKLASLRGRGEPHRLVILSGRSDGLLPRLLKRFAEAFGSPNYFDFGEVPRPANFFTQGISRPFAYDLERTNYILSFGYPLLEGGASPVRQMRAYGVLRQGRPGHRAKIVQVEPRLSLTAAKADEWVPVKPGTMGALALGIAHIMVKEGLYDKGFIEEFTFGFEDWRDHGGQWHRGFKGMVLEEYPPSIASELTGVPLKTIVRLAREFSSAKPALAIGDRDGGANSNETYAQMAIHALNALVGSLDVPGGVLVQREVPFADWPPVERDQVARRGLAMPRIGHDGLVVMGSFLKALEGILQERPYPVEVLFVDALNPLFSFPDPSRAVRAFEKIPFIVSFTAFIDETAEYADLILPDHTSLERWEDAPAPGTGYPVLGLRKPVVHPLYDTRPTGDVILQLAKALGGPIARAFPWQDFQGLLQESLKGVYESRAGDVFSELQDEAWIRFLEERGWQYPTYATFEGFFSQLVEKGGWWDPLYPFEEPRRIFRTPSGRFEFYSHHLKRRLEEIAGERAKSKGTRLEEEVEGILNELGIQARRDQVFLPHHEPPRFVGDESAYPFHLHVYKLLPIGEGEGANQPFLQEILGVHVRMQWEPWVEIHPEVAKGLGIADGEGVFVESPLGRIKVRAKLYPGTRPDVVSIPLGLGHTAYGRWAKGRGANPNEVLVWEEDPLSGLPANLSTRVKVYKA